MTAIVITGTVTAVICMTFIIGMLCLALRMADA